MRVHLTNKILSGFSATLSLALSLTCIWMLTSLFVNKSTKQCSLKYDTSSSCNGTPSFEDEHGAIVIPNDEIKKPTPRSLEIWTEYGEMTPKFRMVLVGCLSGAIAASLVQLICSLIVIFSPHYKIPSRTRRIVYILFFIFIVFLVVLALPLAYKRQYNSEDEGELHTMSTLSSSIMKFMKTFKWKYLLTDLYLYYIELFANIIFLFLYMVVSCCLMRYTVYQDYDI